MLQEKGIVKKNPFCKFNIVLRGTHGTTRRVFSLSEINVFLSRFDTNTLQGLKDRTLFELIYSSGLRVAEVASLKVKDIGFEQREMIVRGKGDKDRIIPFTAEALKWLYIYLGKRINTRESWVFPGRGIAHRENHVLSTSISERFAYLLNKFGMARKGITTHSIRHTTATQLLENGASIFFIQDLLGHKNPETTVRYTHLQIEQLQKVYLKYHPFGNKSFNAIREKYLRGINSLISKKQGKAGLHE
ncbi:tyrosine-type recombinase/integrase [Treponema primitia]|uniref:tyrosine-type recombinase/integrase n=1 Tax=Treponema primitia TaxID=88058 RepID=UPI00398057A6